MRWKERKAHRCRRTSSFASTRTLLEFLPVVISNYKMDGNQVSEPFGDHILGIIDRGTSSATSLYPSLPRVFLAFFVNGSLMCSMFWLWVCRGWHGRVSAYEVSCALFLYWQSVSKQYLPNGKNIVSNMVLLLLPDMGKLVQYSHQLNVSMAKIYKEQVVKQPTARKSNGASEPRKDSVLQPRDRSAYARHCWKKRRIRSCVSHSFCVSLVLRHSSPLCGLELSKGCFLRKYFLVFDVFIEEKIRISSAWVGAATGSSIDLFSYHFIYIFSNYPASLYI